MIDTLEINTLLYTKDGRKIGNAIVVFYYQDDTYKVKTDFGNKAVLTRKEIETLFYIGDVAGVSHKHFIFKKENKE